MKKWITSILAACTVLIAIPASADAAVRLGADLVWMPVATTNVDSSAENVTLDSTHNIASFGASGHFNLGFDIFSAGLKLNYFNQGIKLSSTDDVREDEIDVNAMARVQFPTTDFALIGEGGISTTPDFSGIGYNAGLGAEFDVLGLPLFDLHLGLIGQYVTFPTEFNNADSDLESFRGMVFVGVDFSL